MTPPDPPTPGSERVDPFGLMLLAFLEGDASAEVDIRRDDGFATPLPASHFFRGPGEFTAIESTALEHCRGHVLDVGAGSGLHSLVLQERGLKVTAIDTSPGAVEVMGRRGVKDVHRADIFDYRGGPFDALLMLGHGVGIVGDLAGLDRFLNHAKELIGPDGVLLLNTVDVRVSEDPVHLAYHEANRKAGRYIGETKVEVTFGGQESRFGWLHVDPDTLEEHAGRAHWRSQVLTHEPGGSYLASLQSR